MARPCSIRAAAACHRNVAARSSPFALSPRAGSQALQRPAAAFVLDRAVRARTTADCHGIDYVARARCGIPILDECNRRTPERTHDTLYLRLCARWLRVHSCCD